MKWYLDVDGVINAVNSPSVSAWRDLAWPADEMRLDTVRGFPIWWHPEVIATINDFAAHPDHEVVWLTTWCEWANQDLIAPLGINGPFRVLGEEEHRVNTGWDWWKAQAMHNEVWDGPFVWTDDDLSYSRRADSSTRGVVNSAPEGSLMISPQSHQGLTPDHLAQIRAVAGI